MEYVIAGVFLGALYAVLAGGLVLVYRVSKVLNFAAGALGTAVAYLYWEFTEEWHWAPSSAAALAVLCGVVVSAAAGVAIDHASRRYGRAEATAATAGLMLFLVAGTIWVWGAGLRIVGSVVPGGDRIFDLGSVNITGHQLATIAWGALYALLLHLWLRRTDSGLALRAMSEDDEVAVLHGVRPLPMAALAWAAAGLGSGVAGILISHIATLDPVTLTFQMVPAFVGAALGVLRRFGRAYLGSLSLGVLYGVLGPYSARPGIREVIAYVLLAGTLLMLSSKTRPGEVV
ncbi:MAG: branched-chain amino acid ABC transporter permease [Actinomycetota bacterium]